MDGVAILTRRDIAAVADLLVACTDYFLMQDGTPVTVADAQDVFTDVPEGRSADDQLVFGYWRHDRLDGLVTALADYPEPGICYLGIALVHPSCRGLGVGRALYTAARDHAALAGASAIRLAVIVANCGGQDFWRALGFAERRRVGPDRFKRLEHVRIEMERGLAAGGAGPAAPE